MTTRATNDDLGKLIGNTGSPTNLRGPERLFSARRGEFVRVLHSARGRISPSARGLGIHMGLLRTQAWTNNGPGHDSQAAAIPHLARRRMRNNHPR